MNNLKPTGSRIIAVEEAYATEQWIKEIAGIVAPHGEEHEQFYMSSLNAMPAMHTALVDFDHRIRVMDESGTDVHVLSVPAPGVQMHSRRPGSELAIQMNDAGCPGK